MKNKILKFITGALVILWMIIVFLFSSETSDKTNNTSGNFTEKIVNIISNVINKSEIEKEELVQKIEPYIRKITHYSLYTIGGSFIIISVIQYKKINEKNRIIISLGIGILYAISDEIHQYFVPGRSCTIKDVYIDSLGIATGICFILITNKIYEYIKYYNLKNNHKGIN